MELIITHLFLFLIFLLFPLFTYSLTKDDGHEQPLKPENNSTISNSVPAFPVQIQAQRCHLDLSTELFGGVAEACNNNLDRYRCCPVLAAWLFAAHASSALQINNTPLPNSSPISNTTSDLDPLMPDDSQKCVVSLQSSLHNRNIYIPQPNKTCDPILCFCGIRLHQITSLSCPAAFNLSSSSSSIHHNATPTAAVKDLENNCKNSSYSGCTKCLGALQKLKGENNGIRTDRESKMFNRDCQLSGLTWLLSRNKTAYITTVSAVLRAIMYSAHPHESKCSPDQENMPLAVDSLHFEKLSFSFSPPLGLSLSKTLFPILPLIILIFYLP